MMKMMHRKVLQTEIQQRHWERLSHSDSHSSHQTADRRLWSLAAARTWLKFSTSSPTSPDDCSIGVGRTAPPLRYGSVGGLLCVIVIDESGRRSEWSGRLR